MRTRLLTICLLLTGCQWEMPPIRSYTVDAPADAPSTTEDIRSSFRVIPFKWERPDSWTPANNDQFSRMAWEFSRGSATGRVTLSAVNAAAPLESQISRWEGQVRGPNPEEATDSTTETLTLGSDTGTFVRITGPQESILGMFVKTADELWVFKLRADRETAASTADEFRRFCESVRVSAEQES